MCLEEQSLKDRLINIVRIAYQLVDNVVIEKADNKYSDVIDSVVKYFSDVGLPMYVHKQKDMMPTPYIKGKLSLTTHATHNPFIRPEISYITVGVYDEGISLAFCGKVHKSSNDRVVLGRASDVNVIYYSTLNIAHSNIRSLGGKVGGCVRHNTTDIIDGSTLDGSPQIIHTALTSLKAKEQIKRNYDIAIHYVSVQQGEEYLWKPIGDSQRAFHPNSMLNPLEGGELIFVDDADLTYLNHTANLIQELDLTKLDWLSGLLVTFNKTVALILNSANGEKISANIMKDSLTLLNNKTCNEPQKWAKSLNSRRKPNYLDRANQAIEYATDKLPSVYTELKRAEVSARKVAKGKLPLTEVTDAIHLATYNLKSIVKLINEYID